MRSTVLRRFAADEAPAPQVTVIISLSPSIDVFRPAASTSARQRLGSFVASVDDVPALTEYSGTSTGWR